MSKNTRYFIQPGKNLSDFSLDYAPEPTLAGHTITVKGTSNVDYPQVGKAGELVRLTVEFTEPVRISNGDLQLRVRVGANGEPLTVTLPSDAPDAPSSATRVVSLSLPQGLASSGELLWAGLNLTPGVRLGGLTSGRLYDANQTQPAVPSSDYRVDTLAPADLIMTLDDTGSNTSDGISSTGRVLISGLESGAAWVYSRDAASASPTWLTGVGESFALAAGTYLPRTLAVRQVDEGGNTSSLVSLSSQNTTTWVVDATGPNFSNNAVNGSLSIDETQASNQEQLTLTLPKSSLGADGNKFIAVRARDVEGNLSEASDSLQLVLDTTPPTFSFPSPAGSSITPVGLSVRANQAVELADFTVQGSNADEILWLGMTPSKGSIAGLTFLVNPSVPSNMRFPANTQLLTGKGADITALVASARFIAGADIGLFGIDLTLYDEAGNVVKTLYPITVTSGVL